MADFSLELRKLLEDNQNSIRVISPSKCRLHLYKLQISYEYAHDTLRCVDIKAVGRHLRTKKTIYSLIEYITRT